MVLFTLAVPFVNQADAQTTTDNSCKLNVTDDVASNPTGTTHTLTATVTGTGVSGACPNGQTVEVDFEVESGPAVRVGVTGDAGAGGTASDDGNTPTSPDLTCTTGALAAGTASCTVTFTSDTAGTNLVRGWVDDDRNNSTADADAAEGRNPGCTVAAGGTADDSCSATGAQPGDRTEQDDTDVVQKTWFGQLPANTVLDCSPEVATNPSTGDGSAETYTCQLYNNNGTASDTTDDTVRATSGITIDAENNGTANDPDDLSFTAGGNTTADYNDICTTDANGACQATVNASEAQAGTVLLCFWVDNDSDNVYNNTGNENDGANCTGDAGTSEDTGSTATRIGAANSDRDDQTDVVQKTWTARGQATNIDCEPESDQNVKGSQHSVTCTVTDAFNGVVQGAAVDFTVTGRNPQTTDNQFTNAQGQVTFTYTDSNAALTSEGQADTIEGCIESDNGAGCASTDTDSGASEDVVSKFWFTTLPTVSTVSLDMEPADGACETGTAKDSAANDNLVNSTHTVCTTVRNSSGGAIAGQEVTFTTSGPGGFWSDADSDGLVDAGEYTAKTFTTTTNAQGQAFATIASRETGTTTVTTTSGGQSDSGTKKWTNQADDARVITCDPEDATNPSGTSHVVTCLVTDRFNNPVPGATVTGTETGAGRFSSTTTPVTDANGEAEFVTTTTENEEGDQSYSFEITSNRTAGTTPPNDPCEQAAGTVDADEQGGAGTDSTAPAGDCIDTASKTWTTEPTESPTPTETPTPTVTRHDRDVEITGFRHIDLPGKKKPALRVKGFVDAGDFPACHNAVPVKIQLRADGEWITRKTDVTNENGRWKVLIRDVRGKYRATATKVESTDADGNIDICVRARDVRRHRHG